MDDTIQLQIHSLSSSDSVRSITPHWNHGMIAASIGISLLGAFTSTQLMCQARLSKYLSGVLLWSCLASLTFGFCSIWCLHFVAMLACELDLPIGLSVPLTILSAILAVSFTFAALACDLIWDRYYRTRNRKTKALHRHPHRSTSGERRRTELNYTTDNSVTNQLISSSSEHEATLNTLNRPVRVSASSNNAGTPSLGSRVIEYQHGDTSIDPLLAGTLNHLDASDRLPTQTTVIKDIDSTSFHEDETNSWRNSLDDSGASSEPLLSRRSSGATESDSSIFGLANMMSIRTYQRSSIHARNAFVAMAKMLYLGCTARNFIRGLIWSMAIDSMHYLGILALRIPDGYIRLNVPLVLLSAVISWVVCLVGCVLMAQMETRLSQQFLFSVVASAGVAAMHFTGMAATTFYSSKKPSGTQGYPPQLAAAIATIAIITCLSANYLLAHSATVARNKLAEIVQTRKKLWAAIAQKENAEAAARARSEFIASASHEIRTPLHQLQGYGDLLSRTELTDEGRLLLYAIQHATKSLSLITSNVLDWSRLEKGEASCRPVALDIRLVCESIVNLLPNREDDAQAELMIVVAPTVPQSLFLDETYLHRILMNLLSNAIKFTSEGYVLLLVEMEGDTLVATIQDTGAGIPETFLPDLFEPFKQAQVRGAQRGAGLGLSIIKQLLQKMQGTIDVTSRYQPKDGNSGSAFIAKIPTQATPSTQFKAINAKAKKSIAIFPMTSERTIQGLSKSWSRYDFEVMTVKNVDDVPESTQYAWVTVSFLRKNHEMLKKLVQRPEMLILVPYDSPEILTDIPELTSTPHFVTLQRPLIWHKIVKTLENMGLTPSKGLVDKAVRFAPEVNVMDIDVTKVERLNDVTILLVEDNKINQKLGVKMLKTLGYKVITADDGQEAIDRMLEYDEDIDAILMDQSMPRKDGLTATREIRMLEEDGTLSRRRPIIAVTAVVGPEAQALCHNAGTDDFLPKPLSLVKLGQSLKHHLRQH